MHDSGHVEHATASTYAEPLAHVLSALEAFRDGVDAMPDPAARLALLSLAITAVDTVVADLARARLNDVGVLRTMGWSYQRIAQRSGLSKSRAAQLVRAATGSAQGEAGLSPS